MRARGTLVLACLLGLVATAGAQSLTLDLSFGTNGKLLDPSAGFDVARTVLVQPDGRILVGGTNIATQLAFRIVRYLSHGAPDPSFAVPPIPIMQGFRAMALQTDGKIVAVGFTGANFGVVRLLPGGSPDPAFDGDGHDSVDFFGGIDFATAVAIQPDGKIVVAGYAETAPNTAAIAVVRYLTDGVLDPAFGTGGKVVGPVQASDNSVTHRVLIDSLGRILAGGFEGNALASSKGPARFSSGGVLDATFGNAGNIELPQFFEGTSMALTPDDGVLIVGRRAVDAGNLQMQLFRFSSTGQPDPAFGTGGHVVLGSSPFDPDARAAEVLGDGRFYVAGEWSRDFYLGRFLEDGSLDASFGVGGFLLTSFTNIDFPFQQPFDIAVNSDGDVVLAGTAYVAGTYEVALARYGACPAPSPIAPTIASLSVTEATALGASTYLEISGTGFSPEATVRFGESSPQVTQFVSPTVLAVQLDSHPLGDVDVVVRNPDCQTATLSDGLFFYPQDYPPGNPYYPFVKKLIRNSVTAGCAPIFYCGTHQVTRAQMAVFLLRSKEGASYAPPPATGTVFADVPIDGFAAAWIEELAERGITAGCDVNLYCPDQFITRAQMAVFLLVTFEGTGYQPPDPDGVFLDVPVSSPYARWIEEIFVRGITSGCAQGLYCPDYAVLREQMAVFLSVTFSLPG